MIKQKFNKAFTLAEGAAHAEIFNNCRKTAFTLAEVLIVLVILGVVSALVLPLLLNSVSDRLNTERDVNIAHKFTEAMEDMRLTGKLVRYNSTEEFVDELQKHIKIIKRCDADHIAECWPTDKVNKDVDVSSLKTRWKLIGIGGAKKLTSSIDGTVYNVDLEGIGAYDPTVGLILADGASVILTYDKNAKPMGIGAGIVEETKTLPIFKLGPILKMKEYVYTSNVTDSIDYITDTNGKNRPNYNGTLDRRVRDVRSFRRARIANQLNCETGSIGKVCIAGNSKYVDCSIGNSSSYEYNMYCYPAPSGLSKDYWAGARKMCDDAGMYLPNLNQVGNIYDNRSQYPTIDEFFEDFWSKCMISSETWFNSAYGANIYRCAGPQGNDQVIQRKKSNYVVCLDD